MDMIVTVNAGTVGLSDRRELRVERTALPVPPVNDEFAFTLDGVDELLRPGESALEIVVSFEETP